MILKWVRCGEDRHFCSLERLNLTSTSDVGVYIIWCSGDRVARVGQGDIRERLSEHRRNNNILRHRSRGQLLVSWASVSDPRLREKMERYLGDTLDPLEGEQFPDVVPMQVNLPWKD